MTERILTMRTLGLSIEKNNSTPPPQNRAIGKRKRAIGERIATKRAISPPTRKRFKPTAKAKAN